MSGDEAVDDPFSPDLPLSSEAKAELEMRCTRYGISKTDYVLGLVEASLGVGITSQGREAMARGGRNPHAMYEEARSCAYGCGFRTASKSGLTQHEQHCTYQRTGKARARVDEGNGERQAAELRSSVTVAAGSVEAASG